MVIEHIVRKNDTVLSILNYYGITLEQFIHYNILSYPGLKNNPLLIMRNWVLTIPLIQNGGNPEYLEMEG